MLHYEYMKVVILYRPYSEHGRRIEEYVHEFKSRNNQTKVELLNIDTRDGSSMASLYDIVQYPSIIVVQNNGAVQKIWAGDELPLIDEVASYARL
jgi:hypothetical protein